MRKLLVPALMAACLIPAGIALAGDDPPTSPTPTPPTVAPADILGRANDATARFAQRNLVRLLNRGGFDVRGRATLDAPPDHQCATFVTARIPRAVCLFEIRISDRLQPRPTRYSRVHGNPGGPPRPPRPSHPIVVRHFECVGAVHIVLNPNNAPAVTPLGVDCTRNANTVENPIVLPGPHPHPTPTPTPTPTV